MKSLCVLGLTLIALTPPVLGGGKEDARALFLQAMEAHLAVQRATFNYRVFDRLAGDEGTVSQAGMVAVERAAKEGEYPKFHVRGALIDHHPLGVRLQHILPVEMVNAAYDGHTITVVDGFAHETLASTDPKFIKRLGQKAMWFLPTWLQAEPFAAERRILEEYDQVSIVREADAEILGQPCFALRLRGRKIYEDPEGPEPKQLTHEVDNLYYFEKDSRILRRLIERRSQHFTRVHDVEFLKINPALPEWTFDVHPPEDFARK